MATKNLLPVPKFQFLDNNGKIVPGGKVFTYDAGTTNKRSTFTDSTGSTPNLNPIILDANGRCDIWITPNTAYKIVFSPASDTDPPTNAFWTEDQVTAVDITLRSDLAASSGSSLVGFVAAGASAVPRTTQGKDRDIVSVKDDGAVGDGVVDDRGALNNSQTDYAGRTLYLPKGTYRVATNLTLTGVALWFERGAIIKPDAGVTVTINCPIATGVYQIFDITNAAAVVTGGIVSQWMYPEWWGAVGDGVVDNTASYQAAINAAQVNGGGVWINPSGVRWLISSGLTVNVTAGPLTIAGVGKYASVVRYGGTGKWLSPTGGNSSIQVLVENFTLQLNGAAGTGIDASQFVSSTFRSLRIASSTGAANGTGISSRPTNNAWAPFFNVADDITLDTLSSGMVFDTAVGNAPNRWKIGVVNQLGGTDGIKIGTNSTNLVAGIDIMMFYCDQQTGKGITLGPNADRISMGLIRQETAAGGQLFSIDNAANRFTLMAYQSHAGALGTSALGLRAMMLGQWDEGLVWTGSSVTTQMNVDRSSDTGIQFTGKIFAPTDGAAAQTGSATYAGTGAPNNANGANGDIYFRSDGGAGTTIYQRRAGAWVGIV